MRQFRLRWGHSSTLLCLKQSTSQFLSAEPVVSTSQHNLRLLRRFLKQMLKTYQFKTHCKGDIRSSKTANIILPRLMTEYRWTLLRVQNRIRVQMHPCVVTGGVESNVTYLDCGLPQGSSLGPLKFIACLWVAGSRQPTRNIVPWICWWLTAQ